MNGRLALALCYCFAVASAAAEQPKPHYYAEIATGKFSPDVMLFSTGMFFGERGPVLPSNYLVVYLKAAMNRPAGVSYFTVDEQMDCNTHKSTMTYTAYAEDGAVVTKSDAIPPEEVALVPGAGPGYSKSWAQRCDRALGKGPPLHVTLAPPIDRATSVSGIDGALALARQREADIDTAEHLPDKGKYALYGDLDPKTGVTYIDYSRIDPKATSREISWLLSALPRADRATCAPPGWRIAPRGPARGS